MFAKNFEISDDLFQNCVPFYENLFFKNICTCSLQAYRCSEEEMVQALPRDVIYYLKAENVKIPPTVAQQYNQSISTFLQPSIHYFSVH